MACDKAILVALHHDGELEAFEGKALEAHAASCRDCAEEYRRLRALSAALRRDVPRHAPPPGLEERVRRRVAGEAAASRRPAVTRRWLALAASLLLAASLGGALTYEIAPPPRRAVLAEEVVAGHVRSLMAGHLTDVASSDQHTVKPWFNGRLALSPPVKDLTAQGFVLVGGRLDYVAGEPAAALVYRHRQHVINLFVLPASTGEAAAPVEEARHGFNIVRWAEGGLAYWAVSDLNPTELRDFERLVRAPG